MNIMDAARNSALPDDFAEYADVASGLKRVAGNHGVYVKILKSFLGSEEISKLKEQAESGDIEAAAATAHGVKGMSGNLSLTKLYETTMLIEGQLKQGSFEPETLDLFLETAEKTGEYLKLLLAAEQ